LLAPTHEREGLVFWNEQTDTELFSVFWDWVRSIKRVLTTNRFIITTQEKGVKLLSIKDVATNQFSLDILFEVYPDDYFRHAPGKFDIQVTHSKLLMASGRQDNWLF
jgi:MoaA/NifB/PqqE/SkfB family radical SAM enzyme